MEGERTIHLAEGESITPSAKVGVRHDGGDAETGAGLEMGAGLRYIAGRFAVEGQVRGLLAHEDDGYREWGASASVRMQPGARGRGLSLSVAPVWGAPGSATERLWGARDARALDPDAAFEAQARLEAEMGYDLRVPHGRGLVTPYAAMALGDEGAHNVRTGALWNVAPGATVGVEGRQVDGVSARSSFVCVWRSSLRLRPPGLLRARRRRSGRGSQASHGRNLGCKRTKEAVVLIGSTV